MDRVLQVLVSVLATALTCSAGPAASQDIPVIEPEAEPKPVDRLADAAEVSAARIVVGVMLDADQPPLDMGTVAPLTFEEELLHKELYEEASQDAEALRLLAGLRDREPYCARLLSPDGLYEGLAEFHPDDGATGVVELDFDIQSENWEVLADRHQGWLAVAVTRGSCEVSSTEHVLTTWQLRERPEPAAGPAPGARAVTVFVNGQGASQVFAAVSWPEGSFAEDIACERVEGSGGVGFDRICRIGLEDLPRDTIVQITINRLAYGAWESPEVVTLHVVELP